MTAHNGDLVSPLCVLPVIRQWLSVRSRFCPYLLCLYLSVFLPVLPNHCTANRPPCLMKKSDRKSTSPPQQPHDDRKAKKKTDRKNTSLRLEKKTLKALKIRAIEEETSVQKLIERLVVEYLKTDSDSG